MDKKPNSIKHHSNTEDSQHDENEDSRYWQDSQKLLAVFPPEVWDHICSFLNGSDFLNFINSSLVFRHLFLQKRVLRLFEPVLEILLPNLEGYLEVASTQLTYDELQSAEYQENKENLRNLVLSCRQVCSDWKRPIEKMACIMKPEEPRVRNVVWYLLAENCSFRKSEEVENFLEFFNTSHPSNVNPFPARYIEVDIQLMEPDYPQFITTISTLLEKYGQHLCGIKMRIDFGNENPTELHHKIVEWLNCMPNLQNLFFCYSIRMQSGVLAPAPVEHFPPPQFTFLRKLVVEANDLVVSTEHIPNRSWIKHYNLSKLITLHENLNFLQMTILNTHDAEILQNFTSLKPLKTLNVHYYCKEDEITLSKALTMLSEKFSNDLKNLSLTYRVKRNTSERMKVFQDSLSGRLNLPNLRRFEISILSIFSLDFLLGMKDSIEELIIECVLGPPRNYGCDDFSVLEKREIGKMTKNQVTKFLGYQRKMLKSNIWNMLPKLKVISLTAGRDLRKEFKREDWMRTQKRK